MNPHINLWYSKQLKMWRWTFATDGVMQSGGNENYKDSIKDITKWIEHHGRRKTHTNSEQSSKGRSKRMGIESSIPALT